MDISGYKGNSEWIVKGMKSEVFIKDKNKFWFFICLVIVVVK